jgi:hypothetical protein
MFWVVLACAGCGGGGDDAADADADADGDTDGDNGVAHDELCPACDAPPTCGGDEVLSCCVCVKIPETELVRTSCDQLHDDEFCGAGDPDLSCFETPREAGASVDQGMRGTVDVFGSGVEPDAVTVDVYAEVDGARGDLLGTAVSDVDGCPDAVGETDIEADCITKIADGLEEDCACVERDPGTTDARRLAYYQIDDPIPTNLPLVVVTHGNEGLWKELTSYNVVDEDDDTRDTADGAVSWYEARVLSIDDYESIPAAAGIGRIQPGNAAVAGEIHDCGDVRLTWAQVNTNPSPTGGSHVVYFNGDDEHPLPAGNRTEGTSPLGLYASMNITAGRVHVAAVGLWDGNLVSLGWYEAEALPDSVTAISLRGIMPHQVP